MLGRVISPEHAELMLLYEVVAHEDLVEVDSLAKAHFIIRSLIDQHFKKTTLDVTSSTGAIVIYTKSDKAISFVLSEPAQNTLSMPTVTISFNWTSVLPSFTPSRKELPGTQHPVAAEIQKGSLEEAKEFRDFFSSLSKYAIAVWFDPSPSEGKTNFRHRRRRLYEKLLSNTGYKPVNLENKKIWVPKATPVGAI